MQDCLNEIEAQHESALDDALVQKVKMQLAVEKCVKSTSYDASSDPYTSYLPPPGLFAEGILAQLSQMTATMNSQTRQDGKYSDSFNLSLFSSRLTFTAATVKLQLHFAEMSLLEIALCGDPTRIEQASFQRTKYLYACVQATRQWYSTLFSIPVAEMKGATTSVIMQMRHALGLLYALSTIDEPGWRKEDLASTIELYPTLDRLADFLSRIPSAGIDGDDENWWGHVASTVKTLRSIWAGQDEDGRTAVTVPTPFNNAVEGSDVVASLDGMYFDFPGLDWLIDPVMMASSF